MSKEPPTAKKAKERPFYQPPNNISTSSKIINEARTLLRTVDTKRPFTPRESRNLFGPTSTRKAENRPPSVLSLGPQNYDGADSRPVSGTRLSPLDYNPAPPLAADVESRLMCPKPPTDPNRSLHKRGSGRSGMYRSSSLTKEPSLNIPITSDKSKDLEKASGDKIAKSQDESTLYESEARQGSGGSSDPVYHKHISPMLSQIMDPAFKREPEKMEEVMDQLYDTLLYYDLLGRGYRKRTAILKALFKQLDISSVRVVLKVARIVLSLKVSGNNLTNVCKLMYRVSKEESNDDHFLHGNILDLLVRTVTLPEAEISWEALVYSLGSLKFLSGNLSISQMLMKKDCIESLSQLLERADATTRRNGKISDEIGNILIQLMAILRNLAEVSQTREKFISCGIIVQLSSVMESYHQDGDLMLNISRILSRLTIHHDCCSILAEQDCYRWFLHILIHQMSKQDLILRVCFVLGNLTARFDESRLRMYALTDCLDTVVSVLKFYIDYRNSASISLETAAQETGDSNAALADDVLVKVIRLIANLSINEKVGSSIAANPTCIDYLLHIIDTREASESEELIVNTVATINNISFYSISQHFPDAGLMRIADSMMKLLEPSNRDTLLEVTRVFGNITHHHRLRNYLFNKNLVELMVALLDSDQRELVYAACGVLVNLMADEDKRATFRHESGVDKLLEVLRDLARGDWQLAAVCCQLLWNYSSRINSSQQCFGESNSQLLFDLLVELTDDEAAFDDADMKSLDDEERSLLQERWSIEFCPIACELLRRIEKNSSQFDVLSEPS